MRTLQSLVVLLTFLMNVKISVEENNDCVCWFNNGSVHQFNNGSDYELGKLHEPYCSCGRNWCDKWNCGYCDWGPWTECTHDCSISIRCRYKNCGCNIYYEYRNCAKFCYNNGVYHDGCTCDIGTKGHCCECASPQYCKTGDQYYNCLDGCTNGCDSICNECQNDAYYIQHDTGKCGVCNIPRYCKTEGGTDVGKGDYWCNEHDSIESCLPSGPSCCKTCQNTTATSQAYYLDVGITNQCTPKCNWLGHLCFPGVCDNNNYYLYTTCNCTDGFQLYKPSDEITKCKLIHSPDIQTCRLGAESPMGEAANSTFLGNSTSCASTMDAFVNFEIDHMFFEYSFSFGLPQDPPSRDNRHEYVKAFAFGVVDAKDTIKYYNKEGIETILDVHDSSDHSDGMCSVGEFNRDNPLSGMLITCRLNANYGDLSGLDDGEKVCHHFEVTGSGYVDVQDMMFLDQDPTRNYYDLITAKREICFHTDYTSPDHCTNVNESCTLDILNFGHRVKRHKALHVMFDGWFDPVPDSLVSPPSGLKSYEVEVRDVIYSTTELYTDFKSLATYESFGHPVNITLPDRHEPSMFAVYLWVLDNTQEGPNFRIARRFVLTDNTSDIEIHSNHPIYVVSASSETGLEWQTHLGPVKLDWEKHFYNNWHVHTNLLLPIRPEGNMSITGSFEQETGELPVSGTPNVDGVVNFKYRYHRISLEGIERSLLKDVSLALEERYTMNDFNRFDGDWVKITLRAIDIMNNTLDDEVTVKIDSSVPLIKNMYLTKDGYRQLFIHNTTNLSEMNMTFMSYDPHSGMKSIFWKLGTEPGLSDIGKGALPVVRKNENELCLEHCYCPFVHGSLCEQYNFSIPLAGLIPNGTHIGDHNREYHFKFTVMNEAHLVTEEVVTILIDTSPPEVGHVFDGLPGYKDRDYQSESTLYFHWEGFIDHESGISKYHIAIGQRCFRKEELQFMHLDTRNLTEVNHFTKKYGTTTVYKAKEPGFYQISVIAFNGAMDPSESVCSSGMIYDVTPPEVQNIQLVGSVHPNVIFCNENTTWFLDKQGVLQLLSQVDECINHCENGSVIYNYKKFPQSSLKNGTSTLSISVEKSKHICEVYELYTEDNPIFLHNDNIHVNWTFYEQESQMLDYHIGLASNRHSIERPDIRGFVSSHNKTDYKCVHCGLGQGELFFISLKAMNKATLTEFTPVGPVIIDMTPPMYTGGMVVVVDEEFAILQWEFESFWDEDYEAVLLEYQWALGTSYHYEEVISWTKQVFPYNYYDDEDIEKFQVKVHKSILQLHDQDMGKQYVFSLRTYNRADLYTLTLSQPFHIHSKVLPSSGIVNHVDPDNVNGGDVSFQENTKSICLRWYGFVHDSETLNFSVGIGSQPYLDDVVSLHIVPETDDSDVHCVMNITLQPNKQYFGVVIARNSQGQANSTSHGVYVTSIEELYRDSVLNVGGNCPAEFKYVLMDNSTENKASHLNAVNTKYTQNVNIPMISQMYMTLRVKFIGNLSDIAIQYNNEELTINTWDFMGEMTWAYYEFIQMKENFTLSLTMRDGTVLIEEALDFCKENNQVQMGTNSLNLKWSFHEPHVHNIDNYKLILTHYHIDRQLCFADENSVVTMAGNQRQIILKMSFEQGKSYTLCLLPCFQRTCLNKCVCEKFTIDNIPPRTGGMEAYLNKDNRQGLYDGNFYHLEASWDLFLEHGLESWQPLQGYDWSIGLDNNGGGLLFSWRRIFSNDTLIVKLDERIHVHIYKYKPMYLVVRSAGHNIIKTAASEIVLADFETSPGVQVFDLPSDYNLDTLKDYLHSTNLGNLTTELHNNDVDFTLKSTAISGAILGCDCGQYTWALQTDRNTECQSSNDITCLSVKESLENIIRFTLQSFQYGVNYTICVTSGGQCTDFRACSNGFILDTKPPLPGSVVLGYDGRPFSSDTTTVFISWDGFRDIEEDTGISYAHGINYFEVALGSAPGEQDIVNSHSVGISQHIYISGLSLVNGRKYYATVKACDHVDLCTSVTSTDLLVDSSPPITESVSVYFPNTVNQMDDSLMISWSGTKDPESGISLIEIAMGTSEYGQEMYPYTRVDHTESFILRTDRLLDGQKYYAHIKATNKVGLWTLTSSAPVYYDSSPPEVGYVRHGLSGSDSYTRDGKSIQCHWGGFSDPHTGVFFYRLSVGTTPYGADVIIWTDMGTKTEFNRKLLLTHGIKYYITVEACNTVLLCSKAISNGLVTDSTPPIPGKIFVGYSEDHQQYQYSRASLSIRWIGFQDPQSSIDSFHWCISSFNHSCDIVPQRSAYTSKHVNPVNLDLPLETDLSVIVTARNKVGLITAAVSMTFIIDITPPEVVRKPSVVTKSSFVENTQFDRSYVALKWEMTDRETPVLTYEISLQAHHDGITPLTNMILGDVKDVLIPLSIDQQLKDGNIYSAKVTGCNTAGLCTTSESNDFLVDSSPPILGGFVEPMSWRKESGHTILSLAWDRFTDPHSEVAKYYLMVSSTYNGYDLSDGIRTFSHQSGKEKQEYDIVLENEDIKIDELIYVSIWAENKVGLMTDAAKVSLFVLSTEKSSNNEKAGVLDIQKHSCDIHYCNNDCTCAVVNGYCVPNGIKHRCQKDNITNTDRLEVIDGMYKETYKMYTPSSVCLSGYWKHNFTSDEVLRFEWSVSMTGHNPGFGVIDVLNDKYLFDVELYDQAIFCHKGNATYLQGENYQYHVNAWHSFNEYTHFISQGVTIDTTPPKIVMGRHVLDMDSDLLHEMDFTNDTSGVYADWDGVFSDMESGIHHYELAMGTSSGGNEVYGPINIGLSTNFSYTDIELLQGYHYYTTIYAYNELGMIEFATSSGFVVDLTPPDAGTVFCGNNYFDETFHTGESVAVSWLGFTDQYSYIKTYEYALVEDKNTSDVMYKTTYLSNQIEIPGNFEHGKTYYVKVRSTDAAGHISETVTSNPIIIDQTQPVLSLCQSVGDPVYSGEMHCDCQPIVKDHDIKPCLCTVPGNFTTTHGHMYEISVSITGNPGLLKAKLELEENVQWVLFQRINEKHYQHISYHISKQGGDITPVLYTEHEISGGISFSVKECTKEVVGVTSQISSHKLVKQWSKVGVSVNIPVYDEESGIKSIQLGLGTNIGGFQLLPLTELGKTSSVMFPLKLQHLMNVSAVIILTNNVGLQTAFSLDPLVIDWSPPVIENLEVTVSSDHSSVMVSATWGTYEEESIVIDCLWAVGYVPGSDDIVQKQQTIKLTSATANNLALNQGDIIYITVRCHNNIDLYREVTSEAVNVVIKPPSTENTYVNVYPKKTTVYDPRHNTQTSKTELEFAYNTFEDDSPLHHYEYQIKGLNGDQWINADKLNHIHLNSVSMDDKTDYQVTVQAISDKGYTSAAVSKYIGVLLQKPMLTGRQVEWKLETSKLTLEWNFVFTMDGSQLLYEVYLGTKEGAADLLLSFKTTESGVTVNSKKLTPPLTCYIIINAIAPSGEYRKYYKKKNL